MKGFGPAGRRRVWRGGLAVYFFFLCVGVGIVSAEASKWMKKPLKKGQAWLGGQKWCKDHFLFFCKLTLTARK